MSPVHWQARPHLHVFAFPSGAGDKKALIVLTSSDRLTRRNRLTEMSFIFSARFSKLRPNASMSFRSMVSLSARLGNLSTRRDRRKGINVLGISTSTPSTQ
jgi:hypothetical protein